MLIKTLKFVLRANKRAVIKLLAAMLLLVLFVVKFYKKVVFCVLLYGRIGHLATNTELFLRRLNAGMVPKKNIFYLGVCSTPPANYQLLKMYKRVFPIVANRFLYQIVSDPIIANSKYYFELPFNNNEYYEFNELKPVLSFTREEQAEGQKKLREMGVKEGAWFVCFNNRDGAYLNMDDNNKPPSNNKDKWSYHNHRNTDIEKFIKAAEYIVNLGGYAIRVGSIVEKPLPQNIHPNIIDYSVKYRTDFMDIFLIANCKFAFGCGCGLQSAAVVFGTPVAWTNIIPIKLTAFTSKDRFIPKRIWSEKKGRVLTFREIAESEIINYQNYHQYLAAELKIEEDNPEDILDLVIEMNELSDGVCKYSEEDESMQNKYKSIFKEGDLCFGFPSRVGARFLKRYHYLLEDGPKV